jgi:hypothetical protein
MFVKDDPAVLNLLANQVLLKLTAQAGTALNVRTKEHSTERILRLLFM